jgi:hypothetical protein
MANTTDTPKIPEMVERVAQVLKACEYDCSQWPVENLRHLATIIFRSMREPVSAICAIDPEERMDEPKEASAIWREMIDAALGG